VVLPVPLVRMIVTPGSGVIPTTGTLSLAADGFNAADAYAPTLGLQYVSRAPGVATVNPSTGLVTAVSVGSAVIVASAPGTTGTVYDSTLVAVIGSGVAVAQTLTGGRAYGTALVGDMVHVLVAVNLTGVPAEKLGSYTAQLNWNPAVLQFVSATPVALAGAATVNATAASTGVLRFGSADATGVAGPAITLVDVKFLAGGAGASPLTLEMTDLSAATTFTQMRPQALVLSGSVQVK